MKTHFDRITNVYCATALSLSTAGCFGTQEETVLARETPKGDISSIPPPAPTRVLVGKPIDLLFVIDDTQKSSAEKEYLRAKVPEVLRAFTNPTLANGDTIRSDMHIGVVSTDMGVTGAVTSWPGCTPDGGQDGWLQSTGDVESGCAASYPPYLNYRVLDDPEQLVADFACVTASFGDGCDVAQPLEASLKALWPKHYDDGTSPPETFMFLAAQEDDRYGHGDDVPNKGFLQDRKQKVSQSTLVIVVITNNDDCSLKDTRGFGTSDDPAPDESAAIVCNQYNKNLFELARYESAFRHLRKNAPDRVIFAGIVGVPPSSVSAAELAKVDWSDEVSRAAYYAGVEAQLEVGLSGEPGSLRFEPSCVGNGAAPANGTSPAEAPYMEAYPPHRILELARRFGKDGFIHSICDDEFSTLASRVVQRIQDRDEP